MVRARKGKGRVLELLDGRLKLFKAVKGLVKEGEAVVDLVTGERPAVIALGIAPEELKGLRELMSSDEEYEPELSNIDMAYIKHLTEYGDVEAPPPCFTRAIVAADELGIEVVALDLDVETHTDIYVKNVLFSDLLRQSVKFRHIKKKRFGIDTADEFALTWDKILNKAEGFSIVEEAREECMAESLGEVLSKYGKALAIIEIERADGVVRRLLKGMKGKSIGSKKGKGGKDKKRSKERKKVKAKN